MARDGHKSITITEEQVEELEQYGDTRKDQMAAVLRLARGVAGDGSALHGDVDTEKVYDELRDIQQTNEELKAMLGSVPNVDDVRNAAESGAQSAVDSATRR